MLIEVRGTRLYVDRRGPEGAPPLLYLHGGPGAGSYDFLAYQGDLLSDRLQLIAVDQRGVQQSDPLEGPITEDDVIADFEALREQLGFDRWAILGHSYGGRLALRYAVNHPDTVTRVAFENPPWDLVLVTRTLVEAALPVLTELGEQDAAEKLLVHHGPATKEMWDSRIALLQRLGDRRMEVYGPRDLVLPADDELSEEIQSRAGRFAEEITQSATFVESLLPWLDRLNQPALLIKGERDPVTSAEEITAFQETAGDPAAGAREYRLFEGAGHFVHAERPAEYAQLVKNFLANRRTGSTALSG